MRAGKQEAKAEEKMYEGITMSEVALLTHYFNRLGNILLRRSTNKRLVTFMKSARKGKAMNYLAMRDAARNAVKRELHSPLKKIDAINVLRTFLSSLAIRYPSPAKKIQRLFAQ